LQQEKRQKVQEADSEAGLFLPRLRMLSPDTLEEFHAEEKEVLDEEIALD
jgi:hypothetical protein